MKDTSVGPYLSAALVLIFVAQASAQRILQVRDTNPVLEPITVYIGASTVGDATITTIMSGSLTSGEQAWALRDRFMPLQGITGLGKRWGTSEIRIFQGDQTLFWVSTDQADWRYLYPTWQLQVANSTLWIEDTGFNAPMLAGNVPAIGTTGLGMLVAVIIGAGSIVIAKRRAFTT